MKSVIQKIFFIKTVSMYSFRDYVFPVSSEMLLIHIPEINTCQYQVMELTNQIQCIALKPASYVTYCADRAFLLLLLLLLLLFVYTVCISTVKTTKRKYENFILVKLFSASVQFNVHCFMSS